MVPPHGTIFRATSQAIFTGQFKRAMKKDARVIQIAAACSENHSGPFSDDFFGLVFAEWCDFPYWLFFNARPVFQSDSRKKLLYLLLRTARRKTGWALENNLLGKITPYRRLCGIRKQSTVRGLHSFGTCDAVGNAPSLVWIGK